MISLRQEIEDKTYEYKEYRKKVLHKALCAEYQVISIYTVVICYCIVCTYNISEKRGLFACVRQQCVFRGVFVSIRQH